MKKIIAVVLLTVLAVLIVASGLWGTLAVFYSGPPSVGVRYGLAGAFALSGVATAVLLTQRRWRWRAVGAYLALFSVLVIWFLRIEPSNERDWQPGLAVLATATIEGDRIVVHNIRNVDYRTDKDYTPAYYDKTFNLSALEGVDIISTYFMGPAIAHTFVSFAFAGGDHLAISIEVRKKKGDGFSTVKGFFRQYELIYVVADERDLIRLRTNYRKDPPNEVFVYRVKADVENVRRIFLQYLTRINAIAATPEFYNTLINNCTTDIWVNSLVNTGHVPLHWKILASGYVPEYLYESGRLDRSVPFEELRRRAHVNARAQAADTAADFSRRIRIDSVP